MRGSVEPSTTNHMIRLSSGVIYVSIHIVGGCIPIKISLMPINQTCLWWIIKCTSNYSNSEMKLFSSLKLAPTTAKWLTNYVYAIKQWFCQHIRLQTPSNHRLTSVQAGHQNFSEVWGNLKVFTIEIDSKLRNRGDRKPYYILIT